MLSMLSKLSIKKILIIQILSVLALFLAMGAYSMIALNNAQKRFNQVEMDDLPSIVNLSAVHNDVYTLRINAYRHLISTSPEQKQPFEDTAKLLRVKIKAALESYLQADAAGDDEDQRLTRNDINNFNAYQVALEKFFVVSKENDAKKASSILFLGGELGDITAKIEKDLSAHQDYNIRLADATKELNDHESKKAAWVMLVVLNMTILIFTALALSVFFIVKRGLSHLQHVIDHLSTHLDFTHSFTWHRQDEIGHTINSLSSLVRSVGSALTVVKSSEASITSSMQSIVDGNTDLASRTEEQAASLVETAASMTEFAESVRLNAENAEQADTLARNSAKETEKGNVAVGKMVSSIADISRMSKRISEISTVIEGIAFQTNILALNAAVEAARAGEQGRGFAVVAGEVRTLAQRSSGAAKEIKTLVGESVDLFDASAKQAELADNTINIAKNSVDKLSTLIRDISIASSEQSAGIEQVNIAIHQLDTVTQQNSRLVLESSTATQSLSDEMKHLQGAVARFTLNAESEVDSEMKKTVTLIPQKTTTRAPDSNSEWASF